MSATTIYRVERRRHHDGPYNPQTTSVRVRRLASRLARAHGWGDVNEHPNPYNDGAGNPRSSERCGFESMESLRAWFDGWWRALGAAGFGVATYELSESGVRRGRRQVLFAWRAEERKSWATFTSLGLTGK